MVATKSKKSTPSGKRKPATKPPRKDPPKAFVVETGEFKSVMEDEGVFHHDDDQLITDIIEEGEAEKGDFSRTPCSRPKAVVASTSSQKYRPRNNPRDEFLEIYKLQMLDEQKQRTLDREEAKLVRSEEATARVEMARMVSAGIQMMAQAFGSNNLHNV